MNPKPFLSYGSSCKVEKAVSFRSDGISFCSESYKTGNSVFGPGRRGGGLLAGTASSELGKVSREMDRKFADWNMFVLGITWDLYSSD
jgi:hypothetical protein